MKFLRCGEQDDYKFRLCVFRAIDNKANSL